MDKRRGSGPREYEFPSLDECKSFYKEKYSVDDNFFEINWLSELLHVGT